MQRKLKETLHCTSTLVVRSIHCFCRQHMSPSPEISTEPIQTVVQTSTAPGQLLRGSVERVSLGSVSAPGHYFTGFWETMQCTTAGGLDWLSSTFKLCQPLDTRSQVGERLLAWLEGTWYNLAMGECHHFRGVGFCGK